MTQSEHSSLDKVFTAIGLMSGTSLDGVDVAMIKTDGQRIVEIETDYLTVPYSESFKERLRLLTSGDVSDKDAVTERLTKYHIDAARLFLDRIMLDASDVDVIGFHGHTIEHKPDQGVTQQIGDAQMLADSLAINVVYDLRRADVKAGGQGAPLVPVFHQAITGMLDKPVAIVNIGGVANVSWIGHDQLIAFDTGPGNALLDDWVLGRTGFTCDQDGVLSRSGTIDDDKLAQLMEHKFFSQSPPKSLDRNEFSFGVLEELSTEDGAATLAAFTAHTIAKSVEFMPEAPNSWYISGGGRRNQTIFSMLTSLLPDVRLIEHLGYEGDAIEAQAFAFLAVRSLLKLPNSFLGTTGVPEATVGGVLVKSTS